MFKAVVIGGSAGSFPGVLEILSNIPADFNYPIFLALHRLKNVREGFVEALMTKSNIPVIEPLDKTHIKKGIAYLAPSNYHMMVELGNTIALSTGEMVKSSRPSIDVLLESAAYVYKNKLVGVLLSGANTDGANGMKHIKEGGGLTLVQDPADCRIETMTDAAIKATNIDHIFSMDEIVRFLKNMDSVNV